MSDVTPRPPRPLKPLPKAILALSQQSQPLDWSMVFGNDHPVELEVGSGKGLFLAREARRKPEHNFLGIEIAVKYAKEAAHRIDKNEIPNVQVHPGDALDFLARYVPTESLVAVHVYFPDPWWKARHRKRRVFREPLVLDVYRTLKVGGDFWVVTDVHEYYEVILSLMATHPEFDVQPEPEPNTPEHELDYLTNFERKYRIEGRPIYRAHYRKR